MLKSVATATSMAALLLSPPPVGRSDTMEISTSVLAPTAHAAPATYLDHEAMGSHPSAWRLGTALPSGTRPRHMRAASRGPAAMVTPRLIASGKTQPSW